MQINDGEMTVIKSKNFENNYFMSETKKDKKTGELMTDANGKIIRLYRNVFLPEGTNIEDTARIRFKGYMGITVRENGTIAEYISVQEILEYIQKEEAPSTYGTNQYNEYGDDLPF